MSESIDSSIAIVDQVNNNNSTSDHSSDHTDNRVDAMAAITVTLDRFTAITEGGRKIIQILRSAIAEINNANASNGPTDYSDLIEMLREDIPALSLVTTESILYDGATMRLVKTALNKSGHTVYQLPGQSNLEALIDELYSGTPNQHNDVMSLYRARIAELSKVTTTTTNKPRSNYPELQCPSSPTPPPSSSQRQVYQDNPNCPPSPTPPHSLSRQVSFCDNPTSIPNNSQDVRAQQIQPTAPGHESTAILEPPVSQNNSFLNRSQPRNSFLLNNSNNCNLNLTPEAVNSGHSNSSTSSSYVMGLTSPAELQMAAAVRIAHQVSQRFNQKGAKYAGGMDESLEDKFLTYRTIARDYQLRNSQRLNSSTTYSTRSPTILQQPCPRQGGYHRRSL
jgi:hypothetical protein